MRNWKRRDKALKNHNPDLKYLELELSYGKLHPRAPELDSTYFSELELEFKWLKTRKLRIGIDLFLEFLTTLLQMSTVDCRSTERRWDYAANCRHQRDGTDLWQASCTTAVHPGIRRIHEADLRSAGVCESSYDDKFCASSQAATNSGLICKGDFNANFRH